MSETFAVMQRLKDAQKSSSGAPAYSRFINRPLGRPFAAIAYRLGMTPTQVTLISGATTGAGIIAIAVLRPTWWSSLIITVLLVVGYALDSADGQLARLTQSGSLAGEWLDHFFDGIKAATIHPAVLICWYRFYGLEPSWLAVPIIFGAVASAFFFGVIATDMLRRMYRLQCGAAPTTAPESSMRASVTYSVAVMPADYGLLCLIFITLWLHPTFVAIYTLLAAINLLLLVASAIRWHKSIRVLEARGPA